MSWIWIIVALLLGFAGGGILVYFTMRRRYGDREAVAELRSEFDQYKSQVTEHFVETADLVNTLTRSYKNVYDHLETGAYRLVGEETLRRQLDTVDEAPVMLEYIGQRRTQPEADKAAAGTAAAGTKKGVEPTKRPTSTPIGDSNHEEAPSSEDEDAPPAKPPRT